jgi:hypothetical protein
MDDNDAGLVRAMIPHWLQRTIIVLASLGGRLAAGDQGVRQKAPA